MSVLRRAFEALANGLLVALLAPPIAAVVFLLVSAASASTAREPFDSSPGSILLLILGVTTGAYLVGALPAFLAGLALPTLRRVLPPLPASAATGVVGVVTYALTFGSHLIGGPSPVDSMRIYALPAFTGVAVAALWALHVETRHAEAG